MSPSTEKRTRAAKGSDESAGFSPEEKAAMKARVKELKAAARGEKDRADGERALTEAIAAMPAHDRALAERVHAIVSSSAPDLAPRTWYGMPAYAKEGKIVCYFRSSDKFKERYAMFGFNDAAALDEGGMWPVAFALKELSAADERVLAALVTRAVGSS